MSRAFAGPAWLPRTVLSVCFVLAPTALVATLLATRLNAGLRDCIPQWSDEVHYWNEVACFVGAGFRGGYCVADEHPAPAAWSHFGPHGPGFPAIYGSLARLTGWYPASGPYFNGLAVALGAAVYLLCTRPTTPRLAAGVLLMLTFWPIVLYLPATLQESLHCGIGIALAGLASVDITADPEKRRPLWVFPAAVALAAVVRVTWVLVLIPWACVALRGISVRRRVAWLAVLAVGAPGLALLSRYLNAPYPNFFSALVAALQAGEPGVFRAVADRLADSARHWVSFPSNTPQQVVTPLEALQRWEVFALVALAVYFCVRGKDVVRRAYLFAGLNLLLIAGAVVVLYDVAEWRDFRVVAPHLLLSLLVLLSGAGVRPVVGVAGLNLLFVPVLVPTFASFHHERVSQKASMIAEVSEELRPHIRYEPLASPWSNTIFIPGHDLRYSLLGVPPGIGVSYVSGRLPLLLPLKSHYLLLNANAVSTVSRNVRLRPVYESRDWGLYENLDAVPRGVP